MWFQGERLVWSKVSESTRDFFDKNEYIDPDFSNTDQGLNLFDKSLEDLDAVIENTHLPWIGVDDIAVPSDDIFTEANHLLYTSCFTAHRPDSSGWMSLALYGLSSVHTNMPGDYGLPNSAKRDMTDWTDIAKFCPRTVEWIQEELKYSRIGRVRFMAILPGGWLGPHRDKQETKGIGATNIAINNPEGCALVMKDWGTLPYTPGSIFQINTGYEHAVWNRSDEPRIHMIIDGNRGKEFKNKINLSYKKMVNNA